MGRLDPTGPLVTPLVMTYNGRMIRIILLLMTVLVAACHSEIYVRNGVTDGNRFHVSTQDLLDEDPVLQSWVAYSMAKSICQLEIGGDSPARANSYGCELSSRNILLDTWVERRSQNPQLNDDYLNTLAMVREFAYLDEYVVRYFGKKDWFVPAEVDEESFHNWQRRHLSGHKPYTRIVGSWSYSEYQTNE